MVGSLLVKEEEEIPKLMLSPHHMNYVTTRATSPTCLYSPPQGQSYTGMGYTLPKCKAGLDIVARDKGVGREVRSQPHLG